MRNKQKQYDFVRTVNTYTYFFMDVYNVGFDCFLQAARTALHTHAFELTPSTKEHLAHTRSFVILALVYSPEIGHAYFTS